jgi:gas vesicle protein
VNEVLIGAIGAVLGTLFAAVSGFVIRAWEIKHKQRQEDHGTTFAEMREMSDKWESAYDQRGAEIERLTQKIETITDRLGSCYQNYSRAEERIEALQDLLASKDIPFRRWVPRAMDGDSTAEIETRP